MGSVHARSWGFAVPLVGLRGSFLVAHFAFDLCERVFVRSIYQVQSCGFESIAHDKRGLQKKPVPAIKPERAFDYSPKRHAIAWIV